MNMTIERAKELRAFIIQAAQSLIDADAVKCPELYNEWKPGIEYAEGYKLRRNNRTCVVAQAHTSQDGWEPENVPALFYFIDETHMGTMEDPIPYDGNMELFADMFYVQNGVTYKCIRSSGTPLYHALADLVGTYVEVIA